ncbi:hypothetical protein [Dickeya dadantii]|nr:hypothetical protein [Dickeya dadantii]
MKLETSCLSPEASRWLVKFVPDEFVTQLPRYKAHYEPCPDGPTRCVVQHAMRVVLQLELFWVYESFNLLGFFLLNLSDCYCMLYYDYINFRKYCLHDFISLLNFNLRIIGMYHHLFDYSPFSYEVNDMKKLHNIIVFFSLSMLLDVTSSFSNNNEFGPLSSPIYLQNNSTNFCARVYYTKNDNQYGQTDVLPKDKRQFYPLKLNSTVSVTVFPSRKCGGKGIYFSTYPVSQEVKGAKSYTLITVDDKGIHL